MLPIFSSLSKETLTPSPKKKLVLIASLGALALSADVTLFITSKFCSFNITSELSENLTLSLPFQFFSELAEVFRLSRSVTTASFK